MVSIERMGGYYWAAYRVVSWPTGLFLSALNNPKFAQQLEAFTKKHGPPTCDGNLTHVWPAGENDAN